MTQQKITKQTVLDAIALVEKLCPIAAYMRANGFDPAKGCFMVVPKAQYEKLGLPERAYVKKSPHVDQIFLIDPNIGLPAHRWAAPA